MGSVGGGGDVSRHRAQVKEAEAGGWLIEIEEEVARAELNGAAKYGTSTTLRFGDVQPVLG